MRSEVRSLAREVRHRVSLQLTELSRLEASLSECAESVISSMQSVQSSAQSARSETTATIDRAIAALTLRKSSLIKQIDEEEIAKLRALQVQSDELTRIWQDAVKVADDARARTALPLHDSSNSSNSTSDTTGDSSNGGSNSPTSHAGLAARSEAAVAAAALGKPLIPNESDALLLSTADALQSALAAARARAELAVNTLSTPCVPATVYASLDATDLIAQIDAFGLIAHPAAPAFLPHLSAVTSDTARVAWEPLTVPGVTQPPGTLAALASLSAAALSLDALRPAAAPGALFPHVAGAERASLFHTVAAGAVSALALPVDPVFANSNLSALALANALTDAAATAHLASASANGEVNASAEESLVGDAASATASANGIAAIDTTSLFSSTGLLSAVTGDAATGAVAAASAGAATLMVSSAAPFVFSVTPGAAPSFAVAAAAQQYPGDVAAVPHSHPPVGTGFAARPRTTTASRRSNNKLGSSGTTHVSGSGNAPSSPASGNGNAAAAAADNNSGVSGVSVLSASRLLPPPHSLSPASAACAAASAPAGRAFTAAEATGTVTSVSWVTAVQCGRSDIPSPAAELYSTTTTSGNSSGAGGHGGGNCGSTVGLAASALAEAVRSEAAAQSSVLVSRAQSLAPSRYEGVTDCDSWPLPALPVMYELIWCREGSAFHKSIAAKGPGYIAPLLPIATSLPADAPVAATATAHRAPALAGTGAAPPLSQLDPSHHITNSKSNGGGNGGGGGLGAGAGGSAGAAVVVRLRPTPPSRVAPFIGTVPPAADEGVARCLRGTQFTLTALQPAQQYLVFLRAVGGWGAGQLSLPLTVATAPARPAKVVVVGGCDRGSGAGYLSSAEALDFTAAAGLGAWAASPPLLQKRAFAAAALLKDRVIITGGFNDQLRIASANPGGYSNNTNGNVTAFGNTIALTAASPAAVAGRRALTSASGPRAAANYNNADAPGSFSQSGSFAASSGLFAQSLSMSLSSTLNGATANAPANSAEDGPSEGATVLSTVEALDLHSHSWVPLPSMHTPRRWHTAVVTGDEKLLVCGGFDGVARLAAAETYCPRVNAWFSVANMTQARDGHAAVVAGDGRVFVMGGYDGFQRLRNCEVYTPATDTWSQIAPLLDAREGHAAAMCNGYIVVIGGYDGQKYHRSVEVYDVLRDTWVRGPELGRPRYQVC